MGCDNEPKNRDNWRLYHLLELEQPVTAKQVQWTFRKVTLRHHFYQAYLVLSDVDRKSLYDALGEDAVGFIHSGSWGPLMHLIGSKGTVCFYCGSMLVAFIMLLLFFLFLGLRVDDHTSCSWLAVIAPLFVFVIMVVIITALALIVSLFWRPPWEEGMRFVERIPAVGNFIAAVCYAIFCFLVATEVRNGPTSVSRKFTAYFVFLIIADGVYYLSSLVWRWPRYVRLQMEIGLNNPNRFLYNGFFLMGWLYLGVSVAQWVMLGRRIDQRIQISWYATFIPFCLRAGLRVLEAFMRSMVKRTIGVKTVMGVAFDTLGSFFFNGMLLVSLYFVAVRITRGREEVRMPLALLPVYVALVYMLLAMVFTAVYLLRKNAISEREERLNNLKWTPTDMMMGSQGGPTLLRNLDAGAVDADWDAIDDDDASSSLVFRAKGDETSDDYDDFDSAAEAHVVPKHTEGEAARTPYGVSAPPDEDARPYTGSRTSTRGGGKSIGRPPVGAVHHELHDPKTDVAHVGSTFSDYDEEEEEGEDEEDYDDEYVDEDDRIGTLMSSSPTSSAYFTPSIHSVRQ
ncbi:hypothetical protein TraAM80_04448 [Trypanosoma rangeli]|uniref:J domain-containing protein n=1 Tax=Trypanosoma rangeli TaxID=5698 RepID=A0A422NJ92_TRYRA|nr:uncharacterized protein TraAM80_04448 [Trypanosoma rangeli]RNF05526.1 hypothetical protein TraAM80_04448 [Trypanosoma rangeli]|eukprot:RNF05526.1 hypothetical protein TraAM80_04448 [Trypanosoma rangeli]